MSDAGPVRVAVVGHTNTGKTSLLRTLTRDVSFGEVSDHPAVTRHVEGTALLVDGRPVLELYDTPGLEDSGGLLEHLDALAAKSGGGRRAGIEVIEQFLESPGAAGRFAQEAKALRQVIGSTIGLYVIDARDRVLGKHRDELEILGRCTRPIVPVLNFTAGAGARTDEWRTHLARVNMHAVAEFDTVVFDEAGERRLFEKMQTLLPDDRRTALETLIEDRARLRRRLVKSAAAMVADLLIDAAAYVELVSVEEKGKGRGRGEGKGRGRGEGRGEAETAIEAMQQRVRERETQCALGLLALFAFRPEDGRLGDMDMADGRWGLDLFDPEALKRFGVRAGGAAAAGVVVGLAIDAMSVGITMGAATVTGATIGALIEAGRTYGRRIVDRARGYRELRCTDGTIWLLLLRQVALVRALLARGHAAMEPVVVSASEEEGEDRGMGAGRGMGRGSRGRLRGRKLPAPLLKARAHPAWSALADLRSGPALLPAETREKAEEELTAELVKMINLELPTRHV